MSRSALPFHLFKLPSIRHYKEKGKIAANIDEHIADPSRRFETDPTKLTGHSLGDYKKVWNRQEHPNRLLVLSDSVLDQIRENMANTSGIFVIHINHMPYNIVVPSRTRLGNIAQYKHHRDDPSLLAERSASSQRTASLEAHDMDSHIRPEDPSNPYLILLDKLGFFDEKNKWHTRPPRQRHGMSLSMEGGTRKKHRRQIGMGCACANRFAPMNTLVGGARKRKGNRRSKRVTKKHRKSRNGTARR